MMNPLRTLEEALVQHVSAIQARIVIARSRRPLRDPNHLGAEEQAARAGVRDTCRGGDGGAGITGTRIHARRYMDRERRP